MKVAEEDGRGPKQTLCSLRLQPGFVFEGSRARGDELEKDPWPVPPTRARCSFGEEENRRQSCRRREEVPSKTTQETAPHTNKPLSLSALTPHRAIRAAPHRLARLTLHRRSTFQAKDTRDCAQRANCACAPRSRTWRRGRASALKGPAEP